jgi:hypothetical protein
MDFLGCVECSTKPVRKGVIAKMAYLVEFWIILESELLECSPHRIFVLWI